ncbi:hypothetical protein IKF89_02190 [Candidatus Saccharibacteria bacterium]|nr:hypothetical protein [Candidatus Saccharibacteria bacterium]
MPRRKFLKPKKARSTYTNRLSYDDLINAESALGRTLFGPIPVGHQREFFAARKNVWIWHESWVDNFGAWQELTVRYEVRPTGVFKRANKGNYEKIEGEELNNFRKAAHSYLNLVKTKLYC